MKYWMKHILPLEVEDNLETIGPFFTRLEPLYMDRLSTGEILERAKDSRMFLDILMDISDKAVALFILESVEYPRTTSLRVMGSVGDIGAENINDAIIFIDWYFTDLARKSGHGFVEFEGRKGWARKFKQMGSPIHEHSVVIKKIEGCHENSHQDRFPDDGRSGEVRAARG